MSGQNPLTIGLFLSMEVLCGFTKMIILVDIVGDWAGQLGESEEHWMIRLRVVWIINSELQGGRPGRPATEKPCRTGPHVSGHDGRHPVLQREGYL
jgi:hypothetical protein